MSLPPSMLVAKGFAPAAAPANTWCAMRCWQLTRDSPWAWSRRTPKTSPQPAWQEGDFTRRIARGVTRRRHYNANPDSMEAALDTLGSLPVRGRRIAVLGRMGELGEIRSSAAGSAFKRNAGRIVDALISRQARDLDRFQETARAAGLKEVTCYAGYRRRLPTCSVSSPRRATSSWIKGGRAARMGHRSLLMLYYLYELGEWAQLGCESDFFKALNVFSYITFRSICAASTAFLLSIIFGKLDDPGDSISLKFGQPIRTKEEVNKLLNCTERRRELPQWVEFSSSARSLSPPYCGARPENPLVWVVSLARSSVAASASTTTGSKSPTRDSKGISAGSSSAFNACSREFLPRFLFSIVQDWGDHQTTLHPVLKEPIIFSLGWLTFVFYLLVIVGTSNAVNLTDGLDGYTGSDTATVASAYTALAYLAGNARAAEYLQIPLCPIQGACRCLQRPARLLLGLPLVERLSRPCIHGRHRFACHRWNARCRGHLLQTGDPSRDRRRRVRHGSAVGHPSGCQLQDDRQAHHQDVADPSPFRTQRLEGEHGDRPLLDHVHPLRPAWACDLEAAMIYSGKRAVVLGLGHSGEAAAILLREEGAEVTICDSNDSPGLRDKGSTTQGAGHQGSPGVPADSDPDSYDVCVLSPGIDPAVPLVQNVLRKKIPIIGELELAFEECICPVVAITGTNGKTTTTELTTAMLQGSGVRAMASGNIGLPFATAVRQSNELDVMVSEVSSFQLETIDAFRPHVSVWLNLSPNHLDRYRDMDEYRRAKLGSSQIRHRRTTRWSTPAKTFPRSPRAHHLQRLCSGCGLLSAGRYHPLQKEPVLDQRKTRLAGLHNAENLMAALGVGLALGVDFEKVGAPPRRIHAPVHRCEFVRELEGVRWINDSKATNLDSLEKAILSQTPPDSAHRGRQRQGIRVRLHRAARS